MPMIRIGDKTIYEPSREAQRFSAHACGIIAKIFFALALICFVMGW